MRLAVVGGASGFVGGHLVRSSEAEGIWVGRVDVKTHERGETEPDGFMTGDLRDPYSSRHLVHQPAANMASAGFIFPTENDSEIVPNLGTIYLNTLYARDGGQAPWYADDDVEPLAELKRKKSATVAAKPAMPKALSA